MVAETGIDVRKYCLTCGFAIIARIASYRAELAGTAQARQAARFLLLTPPLPALARPPYAMLAAAAVSLLPGWARRPEMLLDAIIQLHDKIQHQTRRPPR